MDLWPRQRQSFSGFTLAEVEKMKHLHKESSEQSLNEEFYKNLARLFNRSSGRAGKSVVKWTEVFVFCFRLTNSIGNDSVPLERLQGLKLKLLRYLKVHILDTFFSLYLISGYNSWKWILLLVIIYL
ncbi:unnamed protein product [Fraxinus pennsylvanica]|uniref:Uncharacterized protein n=1 Tax=Fraxinus pennsylvanica TaxID=56036 RepID=A0AAD2E657_9LAMI|nr:unnamed protein product [Fraxinus pennsylvanica]